MTCQPALARLRRTTYWLRPPLLALTERLVGPDRSLDAARLMAAFAHGFVSMELSGAFQLGGDGDEAYRYGVDALVGALASRPAPPT